MGWYSLLFGGVNLSSRGLLKGVSLILCCCLLSACGTTLRKQNLEEIESLALYAGVVRHEASNEALTIVLLLERNDTTVTTYAIADHRGRFDFLEDPGDYQILAFVDLDADFRWDEGEPWELGVDSVVDVTDASPDTVRYELTIPVSRSDAPPIDADLTLEALPTQEDIRTAALGRTVSPDDPLLSPETGLQSLWQPIEFLKEKNAGVFMLEEFDPAKIPVVFINGIGGSPSELLTLAEQIDRERFQPIFLAYPSGLSIEFNGWLLQQLALEIRARRGFAGDTIYIAHSMGGLVARSVINRMVEAGERYPVAFISISTPWLGHDASNKKASETFGVPVWADLVPGSSFLSGLYDRPLPDDLHYYLLFGYSGGSAFVRGPDDGTVSIPSMLAEQVQDDARMMYGLAENHMSILESEKTFAIIRKILDEEAERARISGE